MFELVKWVADIVAKAIPAIVAGRKTAKLQDIGVELFLLYINLNEVLINGEEVVSALETYVKRMSVHLHGGSDSYAPAGGRRVIDDLARQLEALSRACVTLERWAWELQILDGDAFRTLKAIVDRKFGALQLLAQVIRQGSLPMISDGQAVLTTLRADDWDIQSLAFERDLRGQSVPLSGSWDKSSYTMIDAYLKARAPHEQLQTLRTVLHELRTTLERNFSITEVLVKVGDRHRMDTSIRMTRT